MSPLEKVILNKDACKVMKRDIRNLQKEIRNIRKSSILVRVYNYFYIGELETRLDRIKDDLEEAKDWMDILWGDRLATVVTKQTKTLE